MEDGKNIKMLRSIRHYIPNAMKFYNLRNEHAAPWVFLVVFGVFSLAALFLDNVFSSRTASLNDLKDAIYAQAIDYNKVQTIFRDLMVFYIASFLVSFFRDFLLGAVVSLYLSAVLKDLKGEAYSMKGCFEIIRKNLRTIIAASFVFSVCYTLGILAFIVPGAIFYFTFLFYSCLILDGNKSMRTAFRASQRITDGHKIEILSVVLVFKIVTFLVLNVASSFVIALAGAAENNLIQLIIPAFVSAVIFMMNTKLIGMMYMDLVYGWKPLREQE